MPNAPAAPPWHRTVDELVALAVDLGVDGINVDIELLDPVDRTAYGEFLTALGATLRAEIEDAQLSVASEAGERGIGNAATAAAAGVDRLFLMGYDYHWGGSPPGASAPVDRFDGIPTLRWTIGRYVEAGVPRDRILLGLPLYGMTWRTIGPDRDFAVLGNGIAWLSIRSYLMPPFWPSASLRSAKSRPYMRPKEWATTTYSACSPASCSVFEQQSKPDRPTADRPASPSAKLVSPTHTPSEPGDPVDRLAPPGGAAAGTRPSRMTVGLPEPRQSR